MTDVETLRVLEGDAVRATAYALDQQYGFVSEATQYYKRAVSGLEQFVTERPDYADGFYLLGNAYFADNQRPKAIQAYTKALELAPAFAKAHYNLGMIYVLERNRTSAMAQYNQLLKVDSELAAQLKAEIDKIG